MKYNPDIHHRRSIRLKNYDYSCSGLYFITICTQNRLCLFGKIVGAASKPAPGDYQEKTMKNEYPASNRTGSEHRAGLEPAPTMMDTQNVEMQINEFGRIVEYTWFDLVNHIDNIKLHEFIVMPNHIHGIIEITNDKRAGLEPAPTGKMKPLSEIVRQLKTFSARRINQLQEMSDRPIWQRNYYEHIIRDEKSYHKLADYMLPSKILSYFEPNY